MEYDLKIRQSYHGNGGKEGYRYKLYNNKGRKIGELKNVPVKCIVGDTLSINGVYYEISHIYESPKSREEKSEVICYELNKFEFRPKYDLGEIIR